MTRAHDPAHPWQFHDFQPDTGQQVVREQGFGLTIREHLAAMAMQGLMSSPFFEKVLAASKDEDAATQVVVRSSIEMADALIAELAKPAPEVAP